jgi:hypothetical protein
MSGDDPNFPKKIIGYLDAATAEVKAGMAYRLQLGRHKALARLADPKRAADLQLAGAAAGGSSGTVGGSRGFWASGRIWLGIALVVAAAVGYQQWQAYQQLAELADTDAALLSSDLPIDAYLDRGFQNWLQTVGDD